MAPRFFAVFINTKVRHGHLFSRWRSLCSTLRSHWVMFCRFTCSSRHPHIRALPSLLIQLFYKHVFLESSPPTSVTTWGIYFMHRLRPFSQGHVTMTAIFVDITCRSFTAHWPRTSCDITTRICANSFAIHFQHK